jgi:hypothetical protein
MQQQLNGGRDTEEERAEGKSKRYTEYGELQHCTA